MKKHTYCLISVLFGFSMLQTAAAENIIKNEWQAELHAEMQSLQQDQANKVRESLNRDVQQQMKRAIQQSAREMVVEAHAELLAEQPVMKKSGPGAAL